MNKQSTGNRWLKYALIGLLFGIADWYYLDLLAHFNWGNFGSSILVIPIFLLLNYGFWLVPILPIVVVESRRGSRILSPVLAGVITWSSAIASYYAFYTVLLSLGVLPHLAGLNVFGDRYPGFWEDWMAVFRKIILAQFFEWIVIAIVGGGLIGAVVSFVYRTWINRKSSTSPGTELS